MPARNKPIERTFVLGQPLFRPSARNRETRWQAVIAEAEPRDDRRKERFASAFTPPGARAEADGPSFRRLNRGKLIAGLADPPEAWRRVALICGAGLGKTTNLQWLEAALNRHAQHHGRQLAFFLELRDLTSSAEELLEKLLEKMQNQLGKQSLAGSRLKLDLIRRRREGRITLLLDSLDQAGPNAEGRAVQALRELLASVWRPCPIWVSGRPSAFKQNHDLFCTEQRWTYVRVGQLDEPETRFLLEATRKERQRRRKS